MRLQPPAPVLLGPQPSASQALYPCHLVPLQSWRRQIQILGKTRPVSPTAGWQLWNESPGGTPSWAGSRSHQDLCFLFQSTFETSSALVQGWGPECRMNWMPAGWHAGVMTQGQSIIYSLGTGAARDSQSSFTWLLCPRVPDLLRGSSFQRPTQPQPSALPGSRALAVCSSQAPGGCWLWTGSCLGHVLAGTSSFYISCWCRCQGITTFRFRVTCSRPVCAHTEASEGSKGKVVEEQRRK